MPGNYGFRYPSSGQNPYTVEALAEGPWTRLVVGPSTDFFTDPDTRFAAGDLLLEAGTHVTEIYGYLSFGRMQRGIDAFAGLATADRFQSADAAPHTGAATDIFDIDFWKAPVRATLIAEAQTQAAQGVTGLFLDDFNRYFLNADRAETDIDAVFASDPVRNSALAAMDGVVTLANAVPDLDIWVNMDAYLFSSAVRFGREGIYDGSHEAAIDAFAAAIDGVVLENYWTNVQTGPLNYHEAVATLAAEGIPILVSDDFRASTARSEILDYFAQAADLGYLPTAGVIDDAAVFGVGEEPFAIYDRFPTGDFPVFNQATDLPDVLMAGPVGEIRTGGAGNDTIFGAAGQDRLLGEADKDWLYGRADTDVLKGNGGHDRLFGERGRDHLFGGKGRDTLKGGAWNDTLEGGGGNDVLVGGRGIDTFYWRGEGSDVFRDFTAGQDIFAFDKPGQIITAEHWSSYAAQVGDDVVLTYLGETLTILNTDLDAMLAAG